MLREDAASATLIDELVRLAPGDGFFLTAGEAMKHKPSALTDTVRLLLVEEV